MKELATVIRCVHTSPPVRFPGWVDNIFRRLGRSIERAYNLHFCEDEAQLFGLLAGHMAVMGEAKLILPVPKRPSCRVKKAARQFSKTVTPCQSALTRSSRQFCQLVSKERTEDQIAFFNGYHRALEQKIYCGEKAAFWETPATRIYCALLILWPVMHKIKSVNHLHEVLCKGLGRYTVEEVPKRLEKICQRIGLRFRNRGRPSKSHIAPS